MEKLSRRLIMKRIVHISDSHGELSCLLKVPMAGVSWK